MTGQMPEHGNESGRTYDDWGGTITALVGALLMNAVILGVFMLITWAAYLH